MESTTIASTSARRNSATAMTPRMSARTVPATSHPTPNLIAAPAQGILRVQVLGLRSDARDCMLMPSIRNSRP